jgi:hypothetical protein
MSLSALLILLYSGLRIKDVIRLSFLKETMKFSVALI